MNDLEMTLDRLGVIVRPDWTVDAVQMIDNKNGVDWLVVLLVWDSAQQCFLVCDITGNACDGAGEPERMSEPIPSGDVARLLYVNRVAARLFRHYNSKAPSLAFGKVNEEN